MKPFQMPVNEMVQVATLLTNIATCMRGHNSVSEYFGMKPPSPEEYLRLPKDGDTVFRPKVDDISRRPVRRSANL